MIAAVVSLGILLTFMTVLNVWLLLNTESEPVVRMETKRPVVQYYLQTITRSKLNQRNRFKDRVADGVQHTQAATRADALMQKDIEKAALTVGHMVLEQYRLDGGYEVVVFVSDRYAA